MAIDDLHVPAAAGLEIQLDEFYVSLLRFDREDAPRGQIIYKAENFRLCFDVLEPPIDRQDFRPIGIEVPSLTILQQQLIDREIEFQWLRGLSVARETLLLQDPAGNWVAITERREVG
ncbi:MAG TPA: hypothetical protein VH518_13765 [Tepidisphaeraceae bacterium]